MASACLDLAFAKPNPMISFFEILSTVFQSTPLPDPLQDLVEVCRRGSYRSLTTRIIITHNITYTMGSVGAPTKGCSWKKSKGWRKCGGLNSRLFLTQVGLGYWQNHYLLLHCYLNSVYDLNCHTYWKVWKRIKRNCNANFPLNIWCQLKHDWAGFAMCWADSDPSSLPVRMWCSANFICSGYNQCFIIQEIKNKSFCT